MTPTLAWTAGEKADKYDVYFGTDASAVTNATAASTGIYRGRQNLGAASYVPTEVPLQWNKTYYWRIDEVNNLDPEGLWKGTVWSFTTANFIVVDDFEDYTDDVSSIFSHRGHREHRECLCLAPQFIAGFSRLGGTDTDLVNRRRAIPATAPARLWAIVNLPLRNKLSFTAAPSRCRWLTTTPERPAKLDTRRPSESGPHRRIGPDEYRIMNNELRNSKFPVRRSIFPVRRSIFLWLYVAVEDNAGHVNVVNHPIDFAQGGPELDSVLGASWHEWNIELTQFSAAGVNLKAIGERRTEDGLLSSVFCRLSSVFCPRAYPSRCVPSKAKPAGSLNNDCVVDSLDVADGLSSGSFGMSPRMFGKVRSPARILVHRLLPVASASTTIPIPSPRMGTTSGARLMPSTMRLGR